MSKSFYFKKPVAPVVDKPTEPELQTMPAPMSIEEKKSVVLLTVREKEKTPRVALSTST
jgi:hypothetical protein